ncbi:type II secretion system secretin GspD [Kordiimonas aquimaris]|uniref:type II secretion system secretin GspD n=1 Tax=Kordiimonas aquimaris TaxID=707591 RepID=UPI0021CE637C|nr:type II secretion system secretin GspD [Kordiimonas aquimaris]
MIPKNSTMVLAAFILSFSLFVTKSAHAQQSQILNYRDADVRVFIDDVAQLTGRSFIIDPRVRGKINVVSSTPLSQEGVFQTFLSALRVNGLTVVPTSSGAFKVVPDDVAAQDAGPVDESRIGDQLVTRVFRLNYADPLAVQAATKPFVFKNGRTFARKGMPIMIVTDYADNLERISKLVATMDVDKSVIRTIALENTSATEMAEIALSLSTQPGFEDTARQTMTAIPVESSNTLILRGQAAVMDTFLPIIRDLDANNASRGDLRVIYLRHANAESLLPTLEAVTRSITQAGSAGGTAASDVTVSVYSGANAVVINAAAEMQQKIGNVIRMLDIPRAQVLVEAIVVEVSEGAAEELGVQYILAGGDGSNIPFTVSNYSNTAPNLLAVTGALLVDDTNSTTDSDNNTTTTTNSATTDLLQGTAVESLLGLNGFALGALGQADNGTIFGVVLNALNQDTGSNILSTPSILTMDNEPARFLSGQEIPITTGEALGSANVNPFRTIERKNVGIQLEVTPQINEGEEIRLHIRQEISSIAGPLSANSSELITNKREIETTVRVKDGDIIVLGGLIQQNEAISVDKVPFLGDIPLLGRLFRSDRQSATKTNLMMFLRPTIVRTSEDLAPLTARKYNYMQARQIGVESQLSIDQLVQEVLGGEPPAGTQQPVNNN